MRKFLSAIFVYLSLSLTVQADAFDDAAAAYEKGDYKTVFNLMKPLAEQGEAYAQHVLGYLYDSSLGVPEDAKEAVKWYRLAAEQGYAKAQFSLGVMYAQGRGVWVKNNRKAVKWYRLAAEQGNAGAQEQLGYHYRMGKGVSQNLVIAYMWFDLVSAQDDDYAVSSKKRLAKKMTKTQIEKAQELSRECLKKEYKNCY